jgi:thiol-disulfide isomerase/thioredoxin
MKKWMTAVAATLVLAGGTSALTATADGELGVGTKAPSLDNVNWLKGEPITDWQAGQIYVLDFWATWCGPCKASIPHVNELSKKYADQGVNVIGVAIWPSDSMVPTAEFVEGQGDGMSYGIAEDIEGKTAERFMTASLSTGIPTVMVVDREGKLAWVGHPMQLDEPLAQIVAGEADMDAFIKADAERRESTRKENLLRKAMAEINPRLEEAFAAEDWPAALVAIEELLAIDAANPNFTRQKYSLMIKAGNSTGAAQYGADLVIGTLNESATGLNELAWYIVDPDGELEADQRDLALAMSAAVRAAELTKHENASIIDTLARVHFYNGNAAKAIELQKQAIELATDAQIPQLQPALDEYQRAAESKG